jgi:DNA-binding response OmpR family regulator
MNRLLFADNDSELCKLYQDYFTTKGFVVATAADGDECLAQVKQFQPDAVVLKRELPQGGGEAVLARLGAEHPERTIRVIMIADDPEAVAIRQPVIACLQKPFRLTALLAALQPCPRPVRRAAATQ